MARLTKRSRMVQKKYKKKPYTKKTKKSYKSSSKGYKTKSITAKPKRLGSTHWLSYGSGGYFKSVNNRALKMELKGQGLKAYNVNTVGILETTAGAQGYVVLGSLYTSADITAYNGSLAKHFMTGAVMKIMMSNQGNASAFVDIYDIQARNDAVIASNDPITALCDGTQVIYYGTSLFQFQNFTESFKINKLTSLNLAAGETAEHRTVLTLDHLFKDDELGVNTFKGLTRYVVAIVRGPPSDVSTNEGTVGTLPAKVDFVTVKEYKSQVIPNITNTLTRGALLSTAANKVMELDGDETTFITA